MSLLTVFESMELNNAKSVITYLNLKLSLASLHSSLFRGKLNIKPVYLLSILFYFMQERFAVLSLEAKAW